MLQAQNNEKEDIHEKNVFIFIFRLSPSQLTLQWVEEGSLGKYNHDIFSKMN